MDDIAFLPLLELVEDESAVVALFYCRDNILEALELRGGTVYLQLCEDHVFHTLDYLLRVPGSVAFASDTVHEAVVALGGTGEELTLLDHASCHNRGRLIAQGEYLLHHGTALADLLPLLGHQILHSSLQAVLQAVDHRVPIHRHAQLLHGRAGGAGNEVSGIRFIREDDSPAANGQVLMTLAEDGIMYLPYQPAFDAVYDPGNGGVYYTTANTEIVFNTTNNNRGGHFSTTTGRFTAPITGSYFFSIGAMNNGSTGGTTAWYELRVNGSLLTNPHNSYASVQNGSGFRHVTSQYVLQLNDGDYVSVFTASTTGGIYGGGNNHNHFVGHLIG